MVLLGTLFVTTLTSSVVGHRRVQGMLDGRCLKIGHGSPLWVTHVLLSARPGPHPLDSHVWWMPHPISALTQVPYELQ